MIGCDLSQQSLGIVFSIVLVTVQMGLFPSFDRIMTTMVDHSSADLWIVPLGTNCFLTCISAPISDDRATPAIIGTPVEALSIASQ
jgi:hypothetical protein